MIINQGNSVETSQSGQGRIATLHPPQLEKPPLRGRQGGDRK